MSEANFHLLLDCASPEARNRLRKALSRPDPAELGEAYETIAELDIPEEVQSEGPRGLALYFHLGGGEQLDEARELLAAYSELGETVHGLYESLDDDYRALWRLVDGQFREIPPPEPERTVIQEEDYEDYEVEDSLSLLRRCRHLL